MQHCKKALISRLATAVFLTGMLACAQAVELGEASVRSHIGQPLVADIELTGLDKDAKLQVALASADVFRAAGVRMHPALPNMSIWLTRRDGRRNVHLSSSKVMDAEYVHVFLELTEGNRQLVRAVTLWLTPDPNPAPLPAPAAAPVPAALAKVAPAVAQERTRPAAPAVPPAAPPLLAQRPPAAACPQQYSAEQIRTCAALDYKNATLRAQIQELEAKVRALQLAMQGMAGPVVPAQAAKPAPASLTKAAPAAKKVEAGVPWLFIGIASALVGVLIGVLIFVVRRLRKKGRANATLGVRPKPDSNIKNRLMPGKKDAAAASAEDSAPTS